MVKKAFFDERTEAQIRALNFNLASSSRDLIKRILDLDPGNNYLELNFQIIPGEFYRGNLNSTEAGRKAYKHGIYLPLGHGRTIGDALEDKRSPEDIRREDFSALQKMKEQETAIQGYSFVPIHGNDKRKRLVPFVWLAEGQRIFSYAMKETSEKIEVTPYDNAQRVASEGAVVMAKVPAREEKKPRYLIRLENIPVVNNDNKRFIWTRFNTSYSEGRAPEHSTWSFGYKSLTDTKQSRELILYPQDVAAMLGIARHYMIEDKNKVPWNMNPFAILSKFSADFYNLLNNNILIRDPRLKNKSKLRKLHIPEKSILLGRLIGQFGHDKTMLWKGNKDPKLEDYDWTIPGRKV